MLSVIIEATPFLILGTFIAVYAQRTNLFDRLITRLPKHPLLRRPLIACMGIAIPVCECGNIPLARSLMRKGMTSGEATTFLLAAPVLNPITFITTREAFRNVPWVLPARMIGAFLVAIIVGWAVGLFGKSVLTSEFAASCDVAHEHKKRQPASLEFANEFLLMFKLLGIGALLASLTQFFISQDSLSSIAGNQFTAVALMLILGFVISICSNVDAFFALAYVGTVPYGALVTFMVAGPMVDVKSVAMMKTTYTKRALIAIIFGVSILSYCLGVLLSYVG